MGCLLSHLSIWTKILQEKEDLFMILEDDVRFHKGWKEKWGLARSHIPKDADLLYLGGILPPNESALSTVLKPINEYWSAIQPNTLFTPTPLPIFHFCTYSYVLTKSGAQKLLQFLIQSEQKLFLACDHLLMHPSLSLTKYVAQPLLTYCFQEEDPAYRNSSFNQIQRIDTFDSDICNNNDCISAAELAPFQKKRMNLYYLPKKGETSFELYERAWIEDMLQIRIDCVPLYPDQLLSLPPSSWFLVQRPHVPAFCEFFSIFETHRRPFHVLHLSDEFGMDSNSFYSYSMCKNVIRNYMRDDLPASFHFLLPLGYHYAYKGVQKTWEERELVWSFHGTNWFDRSTQLEGFAPFGPHSCHLQPDWNHPSSTKENDYLSLLNNSKFCPILRGNNVETFRLYEALEAGALPITTITDPIYLDWIEKELGLSSLYPWTQPFVALQDFSISESTRQQVMKRWSKWKQDLRVRCANLLE
jgi:GR25 family glycosyltransferase involved in LPS biosynthesis